ncbi:hypothetical protein H5410_056963 [Solanum commersonii]|uniref:Uncharacterized protein n=1 Tax=Solanum commersonii TaxID=4109 RepID=A0A9J5WNA6_SOLCO|nr:hypothetical protein H5410_056963 [Solanum commersonii]
MNTIFNDVNNKFKFSNITPTPSELAVLQLPPEGIENQVEELPPPIVKDKRKGKICSSPSPVTKRTKKQLIDGDKQAVQKMEPRLVKSKVVLKHIEFVSADPIKTTSKDFGIPRASESEVQVWMKELLDFRKEHIEFLLSYIVMSYFQPLILNILSRMFVKIKQYDVVYISPSTSLSESPPIQVQVVQLDKLKSGKLETINNSDDISFKTDDNEVVCLNSPVRNLIKVDDVFSAPRPIVSKVPQPSFAFDMPQKAVPEVFEEAHELPQVFEEAHEHTEEQFPCLVPIQSVDPMNTSIDVQIGTNQERIMHDQTNISNDQTSLPMLRNRRPDPYNTSLYLTIFGSSAGSSSSQPHIF